ncbi:MAG: hypothetical protein HFJ84_09645 [Clostridiales bacterium]|jgi:hypothetical protein|nr:hypothetical protein [Clostridiales bacterium]
MRRKQSLENFLDPADSSDALMPDKALESIIRKIQAGDLKTMVEVIRHPLVGKDALHQIGGFRKGQITKYIQKLFAKTELHVVDIELNASMIHANVSLEGWTVDGKKLLHRVDQALHEHEAELGILAGEKLGLRKLGMVAGILDELLQTMEICTVQGRVAMLESSEGWKVEDSDQLVPLLLGHSSKELEALVMEKFGSLIPQTS